MPKGDRTNYKVWTPDEIDILNTYYPTADNVDQIAAVLGRDVRVIRMKAFTLGLRRPTPNPALSVPRPFRRKPKEQLSIQAKSRLFGYSALSEDERKTLNEYKKQHEDARWASIRRDYMRQYHRTRTKYLGIRQCAICSLKAYCYEVVDVITATGHESQPYLRLDHRRGNKSIKTHYYKPC